MDPLNVIARSHEIALWSRVLDFEPGMLDELMYHDRRFFDYGGGLFLYPMSELPYWQLHMDRRRRAGRWAEFAQENPELIEQVRAELRKRGPLGNRDLDGNQRVQSYRGRKDTALALFYLWISGELMIHHRRRFERVYDFREHIAPPDLNWSANETEAMRYFGRKAAAFYGLIRETPWRNFVSDCLLKRLTPEEARRYLAELIESGDLAEVKVEGSRETWYLLAEDLPTLDRLESDQVPPGWQALDTTNLEEVLFLAPLEIVSARGRAKELFDFEYIWEVYKPASQRKWGYYTLPVLYGDRLVARIDPRLHRKTRTLELCGFWLEEKDLAEDDRFERALANGIQRLAHFVRAEQLNLAGMHSASLRSRIKTRLRSEFDFG